MIELKIVDIDFDDRYEPFSIKETTIEKKREKLDRFYEKYHLYKISNKTFERLRKMIEITTAFHFYMLNKKGFNIVEKIERD